ncbi:sigma factor-like helix-turn-helix DNA-binding protein [Niabella terrae]
MVEYFKTQKFTLRFRRKPAPSNQLAERQKVVYLLARELGRSREAIAIKLNIAPNTVKATIQKASSDIRGSIG